MALNIKKLFPLSHPPVTFPKKKRDEFTLNLGFLDLEQHNMDHADLKAELRRRIYYQNDKKSAPKDKINII